MKEHLKERQSYYVHKVAIMTERKELLDRVLKRLIPGTWGYSHVENQRKALATKLLEAKERIIVTAIEIDPDLLSRLEGKKAS